MDRFKEKLGPWPVWVWGVILGLIIVAWMWIRRRGTANLDVDTSQQTDTTQETSPNAQLLAGINTSGIPLGSLTGATSVSEQPTPTNASWLSQGVKRATDLNYTPLDAQRALNKYLNGQTLTAAEQGIVNAIVAAQGTPPQGTSGTSSVAAPAPQWPETETDPRRRAIINAYRTALGRNPTTSEVNYQDSHKEYTTAQIVNNITKAGINAYGGKPFTGLAPLWT